MLYDEVGIMAFRENVMEGLYGCLFLNRGRLGRGRTTRGGDLRVPQARDPLRTGDRTVSAFVSVKFGWELEQ